MRIYTSLLFPICIQGFNRMPNFLGKIRPLNVIVSSRAIISSLIENLNTEIIDYGNILTEANNMISGLSDWTDTQSFTTYLSMIYIFVYYSLAYIDANSVTTDDRLHVFPISSQSRKITNQICIIFMFVFTKDVLYAF